MQGLSFVAAAIVAVQASAEAQDNAYYYVQPEITPHEYSTERYYAYDQPHYVGSPYEPVYSRAAIGVPEYRYEPEVRYVQVEPVHHGTVLHEPLHHEAAAVYHEPVVHHATAEHHSRYVEVPEELYTKYMAGHMHVDQHEVNVHEPRLVHHDVLTTHE